MSEHRDNSQSADQAFAERAKAIFDDSVSALDAETRSQLNRRRHEALESASGRRSVIRPLAWLPATGAAAAVVLVVLLNGNPSPAVPEIAAPAADIEILLEGDDLEMLGDLEFYSWIDLGPETAAHVG